MRALAHRVCEFLREEWDTVWDTAAEGCGEAGQDRPRKGLS